MLKRSQLTKKQKKENGKNRERRREIQRQRRGCVAIVKGPNQ